MPPCLPWRMPSSSKWTGRSAEAGGVSEEGESGAEFFMEVGLTLLTPMVSRVASVR